METVYFESNFRIFEF